MPEPQEIIAYFSQENLKWIQENNPELWKILLSSFGAAAIDLVLLGPELFVVGTLAVLRLHEEKNPK